jgi:hypothetical protein
MSVSVQPIRVVGLQHAMAELAAIDKRTLKGFQDEYKTIVMPMLQEAKNLVPTDAPMSGWNRSWTPRAGAANAAILGWSGNDSRNIKPFVRRKKTNVAFGMRWGSKQANLFDMTGKGIARTEQGKRMQDVLGQRFGAPSRTMWRAYERASDDVQREMVKLINKIMQATGRNIETRSY